MIRSLRGRGTLETNRSVSRNRRAERQAGRPPLTRVGPAVVIGLVLLLPGPFLRADPASNTPVKAGQGIGAEGGDPDHGKMPRGETKDPGRGKKSDKNEDEAGEGHSPKTQPLETGLSETIIVTSRADDLVGIAGSATEGATGRQDLERRPLLRPGEVLETVPGVIATQHSGGGKANQYFLRGFNLDHGTDLRINVDGMQVNLPSHGHGQGYADLNFLIPELIDTVRFRKGTYASNEGDFSAAGSVDIRYATTLDRPIVSLSSGSMGWRRAVVAESRSAGEGILLGALEYEHEDGPWTRPDGFRKLNGTLRYSWARGQDRWTASALGYDGRWNASDQIPRRAVESGMIGRFGSLDDRLGGRSHLYALTASWTRSTPNQNRELRAYVMNYKLDLLSDFTYFLDDPLLGDQFLQKDDRIAWGARYASSWRRSLGAQDLQWFWGAELRQDLVDNGLYRTAEAQVERTVREDTIHQASAGCWLGATVRWKPWLRTTAGLRADGYYARVASNEAVNSGNRKDGLISPKLSVVLGPWRRTEFYINAGFGFHSNDARGATIRVDPNTGQPVRRVDPLVRAFGAEMGVRTSALRALVSSASVYLLDLDSELVFVGDAGATEASRPSRRVGIELANFYRPRRWLSIDIDVALTHASFTDENPAGGHIPGAIEKVIAAGVSLHDFGGPIGSLRWRYFGARPLIEDNSVRSTPNSLVNARIGWEFRGGATLALDVFNLFDREDADIEYYYASRLAGEPPEGVFDIHFHPMEPRALRLVASWSPGVRSPSVMDEGPR